MSTKSTLNFDPELDVLFERIVNLTPAQMYKAWTTPELLMKWFCPRPWSVIACDLELVPGGVFSTTMQSPEGESFPNSGCFLEIIPNKKIIWTDSMTAGFRPAEKSFMTGILTFDEHPEGCHYRALVKHKSVEDKNTHISMGFETGWGIATDQMIELMKL